MEFWIIIDFMIVFVIAINSMITMGLISKFTNYIRSERAYRLMLFSLYVIATFTIIFISDQLIGMVLLSFLPLLTLYEFSNTKTITFAIIWHPIILIGYYLVFYINNEVIVSLTILISAYVTLLVALYILKKFKNNDFGLIICSIFVSMFETLGQMQEYELNKMGKYFILIILLNIVAYLLAIKLINVLYSLILKVEEEDYQDKYIDSLTNLHNFKAFSEDYDGQIKESDYLMAVIDINHFKLINDTYGHDTGNTILEKLSDFLAENLNKKYYFLDYKVYRYGGEEIIITVKNYPNMILQETADYLKALLNDVNNILGDTSEQAIHERVSFSGGVTAYSLCDYCDKATFSRADDLLYQAKKDTSLVIKSDL